MGFDKVTRQRLSDLDRASRTPVGPLSASDASPPASTSSNAVPIRQVGGGHDRQGMLHDLLPGIVQSLDEGTYYELLVPVSDYGEWATEAVNRWQEAMQQGSFPGRLMPDTLVKPHEVIFFDTETTGLNNEPLFLVGMLAQVEGQPFIRQMLARDYTEEPAVLASAHRLLADAGLLVSYNGTTFDLPYLHNRMRYHRLARMNAPNHLDLLQVARRKLGRSLGNCRLQTLELHLCRRRRHEDIPGAEIPQAYHDFVADGEASRICRIIEHNSYDVITLAELAAHLSAD